MGTMYDAVNVENIPAGATIVAGYVDGAYQTVPSLRQRFPQATVVEITVTGLPGVRVCDCETGDLTPAQAVAWARAELAAGRRPTIYCNAATWPTVRSLAGPSFTLIDWWIASYDGDPTIPAGAVAKQFASTTYDTSATIDGWPTPPPPRPEEQDDCMRVVISTPPGGQAAQFQIGCCGVKHIPDAVCGTNAWNLWGNGAAAPPAVDWEYILFCNNGVSPL